MLKTYVIASTLERQVLELPESMSKQLCCRAGQANTMTDMNHFKTMGACTPMTGKLQKPNLKGICKEKRRSSIPQTTGERAEHLYESPSLHGTDPVCPSKGKALRPRGPAAQQVWTGGGHRRGFGEGLPA